MELKVFSRGDAGTGARLAVFLFKALSIAENLEPQKHIILPVFLSLSVVCQGRIFFWVQVGVKGGLKKKKN